MFLFLVISFHSFSLLVISFNIVHSLWFFIISSNNLFCFNSCYSHDIFKFSVNPYLLISFIIYILFIIISCCAFYYISNLFHFLVVLITSFHFRPVLNESEPLNLTFGITLQQIIDVVTHPTFVQINQNWNQ